MNADRLRADSKATAIQNWAWNQLRHTAGTAVREQFRLEAAQVVLGHATANVTEIYAERNQKLAA